MDFYRATRGLIKKIILYYNPDDPNSKEHIEFFENLDVVLKTNDVKNKPLSAAQISKLICYYDIKHFLDPNHKLYKKYKLDSVTLSRDEILGLIEQDNLLFRLPIIVIGRLSTIGFNEKRIREMLMDTPRDIRSEEEPPKMPTNSEVMK